eukprot:m.269210 g.269210  ORF g.269210 m.269210 type:complete len:493 (+) comp26827_c0_seq1:68-1546(+)
MASKWKKKKKGASLAAAEAPGPAPHSTSYSSAPTPRGKEHLRGGGRDGISSESPTGRRSWTPPGGHLPQPSSTRGSPTSPAFDVAQTVHEEDPESSDNSFAMSGGMANMMASLQGVAELKEDPTAFRAAAERAAASRISPSVSDPSDATLDDTEDDTEPRRYLADEFSEVSDASDGGEKDSGARNQRRQPDTWGTSSGRDRPRDGNISSTSPPGDDDDVVLNPTQEQLKDYAEVIGLDLDADPELEWIARQGLREPLPRGWRPVEDGDDIYYWNEGTQESKWEHPCDERFRDLHLKVKREQRIEESNKRLNLASAETSTASYSEDFESESIGDSPAKGEGARRVTFSQGDSVGNTDQAGPPADGNHQLPPEEQQPPAAGQRGHSYMPASYTSLADRVGFAPFATMVDRDATQSLQGHRAPSGFAWTDLLRTQLSFTRHYVEASRKLATIAAQAGSEYRYTTLDDTRQFIEQNEREIITYEQALCQVQAEQTR